MDKFEYRIKVDEIKELIARKEYLQAAEIADSIDWRRVKSVMMLCMVSDLYKMCRRYEDSRDLLLLAYERHPGGRTIIYSLCELSIKMEEFMQALEYYKEFVQIAPKDSGRYILQYKLYEAQDVSLEERIAVLEELKKKDYREKWAYELAYLYHRVGLATKCVEECDELILWFGEGKYVVKAMELKRLHVPLTLEQQKKYDSFFVKAEEEKAEAAKEEEKNHQAAVENATVSQTRDDVLNAPTTRIPVEEIEVLVKTMDVGKYNTINLQAELAAGIREYLGTAENDAVARPIVETETSSDTIVVPSVQSAEQVPVEDSPSEGIAVEDVQKENTEESGPSQEVFFGETAELDPTAPEALQWQQKTLGQVMEESQILNAQPPKEMANVLSMEADGQISFILPEKEKVEEQITGQLSINDIILEWEKLKKENEEKRREDVRQRVLQQTDQMFTEFEASIRDGLLEQLESGKEIGDIDEAVNSSLDGVFAEETVVTEEIAEPETEEEIVEAQEDIGEVEELTEIVDVAVEAAEAAPEKAAEEEAPEAVEEEIPEEPAEEQQEEEPAKEEKAEEAEREKAKVRSLTKEERELYGPFIQGRSTKEQIIKAVDAISMAAYTGNVIVTGDDGMDTLGLAKNIVREVQMTDSNFSGKIAKISGSSLNDRDVEQIISDLNNGALIIQKASQMNEKTADKLYRALQKEDRGIVVVLEDSRKSMNRFLDANEKLLNCFTARVEIAALTDDALVAFAKKYAREKEYSIDELGILALHTRIADMQTSDHSVTIMEVKEIVDEAINSVNRKTIGHFFDILLAKRYDDEDMIILREKDFI